MVWIRDHLHTCGHLQNILPGSDRMKSFPWNCLLVRMRDHWYLLTIIRKSRITIWCIFLSKKHKAKVPAWSWRARCIVYQLSKVVTRHPGKDYTHRLYVYSTRIAKGDPIIHLQSQQRHPDKDHKPIRDLVFLSRSRVGCDQYVCPALVNWSIPVNC